MMLYIPSRQACYIHIPRTSGLALTKALQGAFPDAQYLACEQEHYGVSEARSLFPPETTYFTIMRDPWEIYRSHWGWLQRFREEPTAQQLVQNCAFDLNTLTFPEMVRHYIEHSVIASPTGFMARYCDEDTVVFMYEFHAWENIETLLDCTLDMYITTNQSLHKPPLDRYSIDAIHTQCRDDAVRFGYARPCCC